MADTPVIVDRFGAVRMSADAYWVDLRNELKLGCIECGDLRFQ